MGEHLADGSFLELSKEQLKRYRLNDPLYTQRRVKQLEEILGKIEEVINRLKTRVPLFETQGIAKDIIEIENIIDKAREE